MWQEFLSVKTLVHVIIILTETIIYCIGEIFAGQEFHQAQVLLYCRDISGINFRQCSRCYHILYVINNMG